MRYVYLSFDEAARAFDAFAAVEPKLRPLWELCRNAAPPSWKSDDLDADDADPFELDAAAAGTPRDDGWCAEDYFLEHVKSRLLVLAGMHRPSDLRDLQTSATYETLYDLLLNWALERACACCAEPGDHGARDPAPDEHAATGDA